MLVLMTAYGLQMNFITHLEETTMLTPSSGLSLSTLLMMDKTGQLQIFSIEHTAILITIVLHQHPLQMTVGLRQLLPGHISN